MKLQRKNKYSKKITAGLSALLISASLLAGCVNNIIKDEPTEIVEVVEPDVEKDENYYLNYYKMSVEEIEKALDDYEFKFPNISWRMDQINTVILKDKFENYKVLQVICRYDNDNKFIKFYDLSTEEHLFDLPSVEYLNVINLKINNLDFSAMTNSIEYFNDKEIVEIGACAYSCLFVSKYIDYFRDKDNIFYQNPNNQLLKMFYPSHFDPTNLHYRTDEIIKMFIMSVPKENRVTSKELGVTPTYREEEKYMDFWKITDEERAKRVESQEVFNGENVVNMNSIFTLVIKDENKNYKLMFGMIFSDESKTEYYNAITGQYLFSTPKVDLTKSFGSGYYTDMIKQIYDVIPYFDDKEIISIGPCFDMSSFVTDHISELREKDGIEYMVPDYECFNYLYGNSDENGMYTSSNYDLTINQIADGYVTNAPIETQVTAKELDKGLEIEEPNKVLVK